MSTETLVRLAILDNKLSALTERKSSTDAELATLRKTFGSESANVAKLTADASALETKIAAASSQLDDERSQFSARQKQMQFGVSAQEKKNLERENDRVSIVIEAASNDLAKMKKDLELLEQRMLAADAALEERKPRFLTSEKELTNRLSDLAQSIEQARLKADTLRKDLDPELAPHYEKLRTRYKDPVAELEDNTCGSCNSNLPLRLTNAIKSGTPIECPECSRYVVASLTVAGDQTLEMI